MKLIKNIFALMLVLPALGFAQNYYVPFQNVVVKPGETIPVIYKIDSHHEVLVCSTNSATHSYMEWKYLAGTYNADLLAGSNVTLKANKHPQGFMADQRGKFSIVNTGDIKEKLIVTCETKRWN